MIRILVAALAAIAFGLSAPAPAANAYGPVDCDFKWTTSADRHSKGIHCDSGPQRQYRAKVLFCGASGCFYAWGQWKNYGAAGRSTATSSTAYADTNSGIIEARP